MRCRRSSPPPSSLGVCSLCVLGAWVLLGCGGSSSETPPPLEPDPARLEGGASAEPSPMPAPESGSDAVIAPLEPGARPAAPRPPSAGGSSGLAPELAPQPELP
jgi:hypothetical protein